MIQKRTIGVIGVGNAGMAAAYALFLNRTAEEIILVDKNMRRAEGEAMDMTHHMSDGPSHRIIGTGTMLDTGRFRVLLGKYYRSRLDIIQDHPHPLTA